MVCNLKPQDKINCLNLKLIYTIALSGDGEMFVSYKFVKLYYHIMV